MLLQTLYVPDHVNAPAQSLRCLNVRMLNLILEIGNGWCSDVCNARLSNGHGFWLRGK